jgi:hypothetical protein
MARYSTKPSVKRERRREMRHTLAVITEAHLGLTKTYCVLSFTDAIELLQLSLVDALHNVLATPVQ